MAMIDWQKDCVQTMWHLSVLERRKRNFRLTEDDRQDMIAMLKDNVARYVRMATQKTAGQRGNVGDLDFDTIDMTAMTIIIAAVDLCLDEQTFGRMPDKIDGDVLR